MKMIENSRRANRHILPAYNRYVDLRPAFHTMPLQVLSDDANLTRVDLKDAICMRVALVPTLVANNFALEKVVASSNEATNIGTFRQIGIK